MPLCFTLRELPAIADAMAVTPEKAAKMNNDISHNRDMASDTKIMKATGVVEEYTVNIRDGHCHETTAPKYNGESPWHATRLGQKLLSRYAAGET